MGKAPTYRDVLSMLFDYFENRNKIYRRNNISEKDVRTWINFEFNPMKERVLITDYIKYNLNYNGVATESSHAVIHDIWELSSLTKDCFMSNFRMDAQCWELFVEKLNNLFDVHIIDEFNVDVHGLK